MWSIYKKMEYNSAELKHVVVTGFINLQAIQNFCKEIFHVDHGELSTNTVIIQKGDPKSELVLIMQKYDKNMTFLNGESLNQEDMIKRAKVHKADACILLTNKNSSNSSEEDYRNILIALAVKKFVYDERDSMENDANIPLCIQLIKPESKDLYFKSLNLSPLQDQLIIVEEIKMNLLAKSCFAPGLIAMVSNLITSSGDIDKDMNESEWFDEYVDGMDMEIYAV